MCFIDIDLIGGNGLDLIKALKYKFVCKWIIMSAYSNFAINGYEIEVENYLLKPIDSIRLEKVLLTIESHYADKIFSETYRSGELTLTE